MKKIISLLFVSFFCLKAIAQNEGRFGIFAGVNKTSLNNADDKSYGDYLPTYKPTLGVSAGYHFTLFKVIPTGFTFQGGYNQTGQNYRGYYADSTDYYAYTRLNYFRMGLGWHLGTNPRRLVSLTVTNGITLGILGSYKEKYELIRYNNDRVKLNIHNTNVTFDDTVNLTGTISQPMYNKTDLTYFGSLDIDVLLSKRMVLGITGRMDYGLSQVENVTKYNIYLKTEPTTTTISYLPFSKYKYRAPATTTETRAATNNTMYGVYLSLKVRLYNEEKHRMYYKEHRHDNSNF